MNDWIDKIDRLNLSLFAAVPSQTSAGDRRSLLAVQRTTARKYREYIYLEIGSYLGGSLQPHLVDDRCKRIYSIDPRPAHQPDDRAIGYVAHYENNSTEMMLTLLGRIGYGDLAKITCFNQDASEIDLGTITQNAHLAFIDGEHTKTAVVLDFQFCRKVVSIGGSILFHDFWIIYPAIIDICKMLDRQCTRYMPLKLEDNIFAIFFDPDTVCSDPYLSALYKRNRNFWFSFRVKTWLKKILPTPLLKLLRWVRR